MGIDAIHGLEIELHRLDLLLHLEILRLRAAYQLSLDEFRGLYISDEQVDSLLRERHGAASVDPFDELARRAIETRVRIESARRDNAQWRRLQDEFGLDHGECDTLLIALAPELDIKYETIYAYLNNDVTRKWPTIDLARRLVGGDRGKDDGRARCPRQESPLFTSGLLQTIPPPSDRGTWLSSGYRPSPGLARFMCGETAIDPRLMGTCSLHAPETATPWERLPIDRESKTELQRVGALCGLRTPPMFVFVGLHGTARAETAGAVCASLGLPLLRVDLAASENRAGLGLPVMLQAALSGAGIHLHDAEHLFDRYGVPLPESRALVSSLAGSRRPVFIGITPDLDWRGLLRDLPALAFPFERLSIEDRVRLWSEGLTREGHAPSPQDLACVADRFELSPGQIGRSISLAVSRHVLRTGNGLPLPQGALLEAAREASDRNLGRLAVRLRALHSWDDLVLPAATLRQVREAAAAIGNYRLVYEQWGFQRRVTNGRGVKLLFSGASGTGKTMAAGVMARDLGVDIYRIDVSLVVSKYIGETEKNLSRIFHAAENGNAILFFDEADALYGKRSEVKDAHDRYSNIEISYLLQKIEEYEGAVILASNLSQNMDDAFARRMHFVVEFPLPDETHRELLWKGMFPPEAPLGDDVDFTFLARQFPLSGGFIRNVSLEAAFLAAQDGKVIRMEHLIRSMARQMLKQGKLPSLADFKQHYGTIG
jgi:hypothetical protein